jgi:hypothetical protein
MKSFLKLAGVALFLCAPLLRADSVRFDLHDSVNDFSFTLPSQPTPDLSGEDFENIPFFIFNNVPVTVNGVTTNQGLLFADSGDQHLAIADEFHVSSADQVVSDHNLLVAFSEEAKNLFSGSVENPTFIEGSQGGSLFGFGVQPTGTLIIEAVAQTPEPGSFVLLGSGLLGIAGVVRGRLSRGK